MNILLEQLFRNTNWLPQIGVAHRNKRAKFWMPPKEKLLPLSKYSKALDVGPLWGCTQLAFPTYEPMVRQKECEICWFGLDIDADDNAHIPDLIDTCVNWGGRNGAYMLRTSCSGEGVHLVWVLDKPIRCAINQAGPLVKWLAGNKAKQLLVDTGVKTCQANRRMFWLVGGKNQQVALWGVMTDSEEVPPIHIIQGNTKSYGVVGPLSDKIQKWVLIFQKANILSRHPGRSNQIYVGSVVAELRKHGQKVETKSSCSGNGQINGYLNITDTSISLWAYADGHTIWSDTDITEVLI